MLLLFFPLWLNTLPFLVIKFSLVAFFTQKNLTQVSSLPRCLKMSLFNKSHCFAVVYPQMLAQTMLCNSFINVFIKKAIQFMCKSHKIILIFLPASAK